MNDDPRLGTIITSGSDGDIVIVGYPYDEGVRRNGGRVGAARAPAVVRGFLQKVGTVVNPEFNIDLKTIKLTDQGDVDASLSLEDGHKALHVAVLGLVQKNKIPFVIGGGNDQSYPNGYGLLKHYLKEVGVVNIDAHLDVRPLKNDKAHSGSPFRQLIESPEFSAPGSGNKFMEFAAQGSQCSAIHAKYVIDNGGEIVWLSQLKEQPKTMKQIFKEKLDGLGKHIFVSFDIDSISSADCPGVSAPAAIGLSAQDALDICFTAGQHPNVKLIDISEFNPLIEDYRTGRLVAFMFYYFALGFASRAR
jgi:formiminoglutamase